MEAAETYVKHRTAQEGLATTSGRRTLSQIRVFATTLECLDSGCQAGCVKIKRGAGRVHHGLTLTLDDLTDANTKRYYMATEIGASARHQSVGTLKAFCEWLMDEELIPVVRNPLNKIKTPKIKDRGQGAFMSPHQLVKVLEHAGNYHPRDYFMILITWLSGFRISDVRALTVGAVNREEGVILWTDVKKGQDNLDKQLYKLLRMAVVAWLEKYEELVGRPLQDDWALFPAASGLGKPVKGEYRKIMLVPMDHLSSPWYIMKRHMERAGLYVKGKSWHSLRRGVGDRVVEIADALGRGDGMELAQALLNHDKRETTERYYVKRRGTRKVGDFLNDHSEDLLPADVRAQIPIFAGLATAGAVEPQAPEPTAVASPVDGARVISLMDRLNRAG